MGPFHSQRIRLTEAQKELGMVESESEQQQEEDPEEKEAKDQEIEESVHVDLSSAE